MTTVLGCHFVLHNPLLRGLCSALETEGGMAEGGMTVRIHNVVFPGKLML